VEPVEEKFANFPILNTIISLGHFRLLTVNIMNSDLIAYLSNYGFYDKEAKVYLTMLELGSSIASTMARRTEINRGTTYSILEDLKRRGIVNDMPKDGVRYYSAISPEILFKQQEEKYENIKSQLPEIMAITNKFGSKPKTQFFE